MGDRISEIINVVILDNHFLFRTGLSTLFVDQSDLRLVGEARNLNEALTLITSISHDIILFDLDQENGFSIDDICKIKSVSNGSRMIMLTGITNREFLLKVVCCGIQGIVRKSQDGDFLLKAIRKVHSGELWLDHSLLHKLVSTIVEPKIVSPEDLEQICIQQLSRRELDVIRCIGQGLKNKQIADQLCIAEATVRHYLSSIYQKLDVRDRLELLVFAHSHKLAAVIHDRKRTS